VERKLRLDKEPVVHPTAYVAPGAVLLGDVTLAEEASVWFNCVLRGDVHSISIGKRTNVQDLTLCHGMLGKFPVVVGDDVTVGHCAILHGCVIEDGCLIGMGARVLNGAVVGAGSIIAAGSVVREGMKIPRRSLVAGVPAKVKKELGEEDVELIKMYGGNYLSYMQSYRARKAEIPGLLYDSATT